MLRQMMGKDDEEEGGLDRREKLLTELIDHLAVIPEMKDKLGGLVDGEEGEDAEGLPEGEAKVTTMVLKKPGMGGEDEECPDCKKGGCPAHQLGEE